MVIIRARDNHRNGSNWAFGPWWVLGYDRFVCRFLQKVIFFIILRFWFTIRLQDCKTSGRELVFTEICQFYSFRDESRPEGIFGWLVVIGENFRSRCIFLSFCNWWGWNCFSPHWGSRYFCSSFQRKFLQWNGLIFCVFNFIEFCKFGSECSHNFNKPACIFCSICPQNFYFRTLFPTYRFGVWGGRFLCFSENQWNACSWQLFILELLFLGLFYSSSILLLP